MKFGEATDVRMKNGEATIDAFAQVDNRPKNYRSSWPEELDDPLIKAYNTGASMRELVELTGQNIYAVERRIEILKECGLLYPREYRSPRERAIIAAVPKVAGLYNSGMGITSMAKILGLTDHQLSSLIKKLINAGVIQPRAERPDNVSIESAIHDYIETVGSTE